MRVLNPSLDLEAFFTRLRAARERVLFVDYDGTLAPFAATPERTAPWPGVAPLLDGIGREAATRVVLVSGRRLHDLRRPLAQLAVHDVFGAHGWERAVPGRGAVEHAPEPEEKRMLDAAERIARRTEALGARVERKPGGVAVHWRGLEARDAASLQARLRRGWGRYRKRGLELLPFEAGLELRVPGRDKGSAVAEALAACGPDALCAFLGDDHTDEDAFRAVRDRGIGVLVRRTLRPTDADLWLEPPSELVDFLARWRAAGAR